VERRSPAPWTWKQCGASSRALRAPGLDQWGKLSWTPGNHEVSTPRACYRSVGRAATPVGAAPAASHRGSSARVEEVDEVADEAGRLFPVGGVSDAAVDQEHRVRNRVEQAFLVLRREDGVTVTPAEKGGCLDAGKLLAEVHGHEVRQDLVPDSGGELLALGDHPAHERGWRRDRHRAVLELLDESSRHWIEEALHRFVQLAQADRVKGRRGTDQHA